MYNNSKEATKSLLDVWSSIELLTPSKNEKFNSYYQLTKELVGNRRRQIDLEKGNETLFLLKDEPYLKEENLTVPQLSGYSSNIFWHIYAGILNWSAAEILVQDKINELYVNNKSELLYQMSFGNTKNPTITPLIGFVLNQDGLLDPGSFIISSGAWAIGQILADKSIHDNINLEEFNRQSNKLSFEILGKYLKQEGSNEDPEKMSSKNIDVAINLFLEKLYIPSKLLIDTPELCIRKVVYSKKEQKAKNSKAVSFQDSLPSLEMINSLFLEDISHISRNLNEIKINSAVGCYLGMATKPLCKDVLVESQLQDLYHNSPNILARWPSSSNRSLALLQGGALKAIAQEEEQGQLFAVNGPPGTGKTTLLFDLIANIYVKRAKELAKLSAPEDGFTDNIKLNSTKFNYNIRDLVPQLKGFEIVVASSNNNAVENITKELVRKERIDKEFYDAIKHFSWFQSDNNGDETWGMFTAVLGNGANRKNFLDKFWKREYPEEGEKYKNLTLFQYLAALKGDEKANVDKIIGNLPVYSKNNETLIEEWKKSCESFTQILNKIENIYKIKDQYLTLKQSQKNLLEQNNCDDPAAHFVTLTNELCAMELEVEINNTSLQKLQLELNNLSLGVWKFLHKIFNTSKYKQYVITVAELLNKKQMLQKGKKKYNAHVIDKKNQLSKFKIILDDFIDIQAQLNLLENRRQGLCPEISLEDMMRNDFWSKPREEKHLELPYFCPKFEELKSKLFIAALKLHEVFIHANAKYFWNSINLFADTLNRSAVFNDTERNKFLQAAWSNFFMIVPVVSTTFHSFSKMFNCFDPGKIGWLVIDEAGQTAPQIALGAIYRSRNVIVVGDPMQTEPISILAEGLINKIFQQKKLDPLFWSPAEVSVQNIADRNCRYQSSYNSNIVGFPLLVHRRCQDPMFAICNQIAYDNQMIFAATNSDSLITKLLGKARWYNVQDYETVASKYHSNVEFAFLIKLLDPIVQAKDLSILQDIFIITLYKNYSHYIKRELRKYFGRDLIDRFCKSNVGTIHSFQGKENDSVIIMLGAQHKKDSGARRIMTSKPNVLNVGISRARQNIYVIGNKELWLEYENMQIINDHLSKWFYPIIMEKTSDGNSISH